MESCSKRSRWESTGSYLPAPSPHIGHPSWQPKKISSQNSAWKQNEIIEHNLIQEVLWPNPIWDRCHRNAGSRDINPFTAIAKGYMSSAWPSHNHKHWEAGFIHLKVKDASWHWPVRVGEWEKGRGRTGRKEHWWGRVQGKSGPERGSICGHGTKDTLAPFLGSVSRSNPGLNRPVPVIELGAGWGRPSGSAWIYPEAL